MALIVALSSAGITHNILSTKHKLEITEIENKLVKAEKDLLEERSKKQAGVLEGINTATHSLNTSLRDARQQAERLNDQLKGAILVSKDCQPTQEFINIWNGKKQ